MKTGALIRASVLMAASLQHMRSHPDQFDALGTIWRLPSASLSRSRTTSSMSKGDVVVLGKPPGSDEARGKPTYPAVAGLTRPARARVSSLHEAATRPAEGARLGRTGSLAALSDWLLDPRYR